MGPHGDSCPGWLQRVLGPEGDSLVRSLREADAYLRARSPSRLLAEVGRTITALADVEHLDKAVFQASFRKGATVEGEDVLAARGLFFLTERRKLFLDATAGHYQMTWGYNHPELNAALVEAVEAGLVWDDHSNLPGDTVKQLARKLVQLANGADPATPLSELRQRPGALDRALLGIATGSVACSTAIKLALNRARHTRGLDQPVFVTLRGNYHGTDLVAQRLRGMWTEYLGQLPVVQVEPNDVAGLRQTFDQVGERTAALLLEPVLMNREAIALERAYLEEARLLCDRYGAALVFDEIQTGFWYPEFFSARKLGVQPDILVMGKGMTAGFHPLSAVVYRGEYDSLAQYDAISTNGNAPLAAFMALVSIGLIEREGERIARVSGAFREALEALPGEFPGLLRCIHGDGLLAGLKFHTVEAAKEFHGRCLEAGLWLRLHVYHPGHSTVLAKFALLLDEETVEFFIARVRDILTEMKAD